MPLCVFVGEGERENKVREEGKREGKGGGGKTEERIRTKSMKTRVVWVVSVKV